MYRHHPQTIVCMENCSTFVLYIWVYVERFMVEGNLRFCVCVYVVHQKACFVGLPSFKHWMKIFIIKRTERQRRIKFNPIKTSYIVYLYININIHYSYLPCDINANIIKDLLSIISKLYMFFANYALWSMLTKSKVWYMMGYEYWYFPQF